jgi:hypothetical protein
MSYTSTGGAIMTVLKQTVYNLDAQRDQLVAAIERDYPRGDDIGTGSNIVEAYADSHPEPSDIRNQKREQIHRDLLFFFSELAQAREHLVQAHNELRDVVAPIDMLRDSRR